MNAVIPQNRWVYVNPGTGDDTALIQAAIDSVEAMTPDANGWRGVVFLNAGEYQLATTLGTHCAVDYAVLHLQVQKQLPSVSNVALIPVADAHVQGGANAGTNFGTATSLETKDVFSAG